jgi:molybdenum cofactor synthesis domain-containing protein
VQEASLDEALGCALGVDVVAREQVPGFANSSMDGFALRGAETSAAPTRLRIVDSIFAGQVSSLELGPGEAMRIMTGASIPAGADAVCPVEDVVVEGSDVVISRMVQPGDSVRRAGGDVQVGQLLLSAGAELTPAAIGVLAGQGFASVLVHRRPVVGVLSTGDELALTTDELAPGQIRDSNRPLLLALLRSSGFDAVDLGVVADGYEDIKRRISEAAHHCDAVVSTGGVSMGDVDFVKGVITELSAGGARTMQVAIKPAKPFAFGRVGAAQTPVFGLPGNPVSTRVSFELFVRPALRILGGHRHIERLEVQAILDIELATPRDEKLHLVHVVASMGDDGRLHVTDAAAHFSHLLSAIVGCNAIAKLVPGHSYGIGDSVRAMVLDADSLAPR